jgi:YYY domain-containing protein
MQDGCTTIAAMLSLVGWYLAVQACGILALPLAWRALARLPDRGYSLCKHLGILLMGVVSWFACANGLLPNSRSGAWLSLALAAGLSLTVGREGFRGDKPLFAWLKANKREILRSEVLFLAAFLLWTWVRACDPAIVHTEQPMDLMYLSSVHASPVFPPGDAWLAGYPIGYYYGGYWMISLLAFLTRQPVEIAYNLGQASWFALLVVGSYGMGANLARAGRQAGRALVRPGDRQGFAAGLLSATSVGLAGNLEVWLEWLNRKGFAVGLVSCFDIAGMPAPGRPPGDWWWWRSSRILHDHSLAGQQLELISEFPFFSYLLGDNHPHLLSLPFLLLLLGTLLNMICSNTPVRNGDRYPGGFSWMKQAGISPEIFFLQTLTLGLLLLTNTWDLLPGGLLCILTFAAWRLKIGDSIPAALQKTAFLAPILGAAILLLAWPFLISAQSQVTGILPSLLFPTRFSGLMLMFGALTPGLGILLFCSGRDSGLPPGRFLRMLAAVTAAMAGSHVAGYLWATGTASGRTWAAAAGLSSSGSLPAEAARWLSGFPSAAIFLGIGLAAGISLLIGSLKRPEYPALSFALICATVGITLLCLPELLFLRDSFGTRMNTVFKLYYQAWPLLALAGSHGIVCGLRAGKTARLCAAAGLVAIAAGLAYPAAALPAKMGGLRTRDWSLNGIRHWSEDELSAVRWIRGNTLPDAVIAEGAGESYRSETNRMSAATGRATLLGWQGHELQWRGREYPQMAGDREQILRAIYVAESGPGLSRLLRSRNIDYLYLGPSERSRYAITSAREQELGSSLLIVFRRGEVSIFQPGP